ncbi:hypothetical protein K3757_15845 [Sulfitobacter sp. S223]|uniref:hypothetical protein n=1 Tax=Sulfitobacter sp. S223 TaxID=2867023 RepID=UPI0021A3547B|nr:hypothetical protein [Sulfitobacter sp. S223]UWR25907.1 hypothetical protein K3757_15845 [Sulfitobacter sp. S223]
MELADSAEKHAQFLPTAASFHGNDRGVDKKYLADIFSRAIKIRENKDEYRRGSEKWTFWSFL